MNTTNKVMAVGINSASDVAPVDLSAANGWLLLAPYGETLYLHREHPGAAGMQRYRQILPGSRESAWWPRSTRGRRNKESNSEDCRSTRAIRTPTRCVGRTSGGWVA